MKEFLFARGMCKVVDACIHQIKVNRLYLSFLCWDTVFGGGLQLCYMCKDQIRPSYAIVLTVRCEHLLLRWE
jgi:hypothetical protein